MQRLGKVKKKYHKNLKRFPVYYGFLYYDLPENYREESLNFSSFFLALTLTTTIVGSLS